MNFSNYCQLFVIVCFMYSQVQCNLTEQDKKLLLDEHNKYRRQEYNTWYRGKPNAKNISDLKWDQLIAEKAQKVANKCNYQRDNPYTRSPKGYSYVGQNLAFTGLVRFTVMAWYSEGQFYNHTTQTCSATCADFLQIVSSNTTHVGCGVTNCTGVNRLPFGLLVVCNYHPGGDYIRWKPLVPTKDELCLKID